MRKKAIALVSAAMLTVAIAGPVSAAPNENACEGQVTAAIAKGAGGLHLGQYIDFAPPGQFKKFILSIIC